MSIIIALSLFALLVLLTLSLRHVDGMAFPATVVGALTLLVPHTVLSAIDTSSANTVNSFLCCNYYWLFPAFVVIGVSNACHTAVRYRKLVAIKVASVTVSRDQIDDLLNYGAIMGLRGVPIDIFKNYLLYEDGDAELSPVPRKICEALKILSTPASVAIPYFCSQERSGEHVINYSVSGESLVRAVNSGTGISEARDHLVLQVLDSYYHCIYPGLEIILDALMYSFMFWWIELLNQPFNAVKEKLT